MISFKEARVTEILGTREGLTEAQVEVEGRSERAVNYDLLTGHVSEGDVVIVNTMAVDLGLGSGGRHFVLWNLSRSGFSSKSHGHIVKLRYTPLQMSFEVAEERDAYRHAEIEGANLEGLPVIVGTVHSQLPAAVVTLKEIAGNVRIAYVMTDGAALPLPLSELVATLKARKMIETTLTVGQAYGGDLEAVNVFSGLVAAKTVAKADIVVVMMGPGVVGTNTALGFSGIEQGEIINAVAALGGVPIAIPRLSFKDRRKRHFAVSHHTLTALTRAAMAPATVTVPVMSEEKTTLVLDILKKAGVNAKHEVKLIKNNVTLKALEQYKIEVTTMGRTPDEEPEFFMAAGCAALYALDVRRQNRGQ